MKKLLLSFATNPSLKLVKRIENYARKHPFSVLGLNATENSILDDVLVLAENT